jgi:hypothetical protein
MVENASHRLQKRGLSPMMLKYGSEFGRAFTIKEVFFWKKNLRI